MTRTAQNSTRMTGIDQIVWNLTNDQDLFCIWGIALLEEPLQDDLVKKALQYLIKTVPILHTQPVTNWLHGKWHFLEKEHVDDLVGRIHTKTDEEADEQVHNIFLQTVNAKEFSMIRISSVDGPMKHYLVIQVHHLVVDGEGLKRICVRFAEIYRALYRNNNWKPSAVLEPCRSWGNIKTSYYGCRASKSPG